jgi:hypothetical protein
MERLTTVQRSTVVEHEPIAPFIEEWARLNCGSEVDAGALYSAISVLNGFPKTCNGARSLAKRLSAIREGLDPPVRLEWGKPRGTTKPKVYVFTHQDCAPHGGDHFSNSVAAETTESATGNDISFD